MLKTETQENEPIKKAQQFEGGFLANKPNLLLKMKLPTSEKNEKTSREMEMNFTQ